MKGGLPNGWASAGLLNVCALHDSRRVPLNQRERLSRTGPYPYYGANGQVDAIDDFLFDGDYVLLAEDGGYFDDPGRGVAYPASGKFWVNNHAHILEPLGGIPRAYVVHALNRFEWMDVVGGSTRLKLTQEGMHRVALPFAPLSEQRRIVEKIESLFARSARARDHLVQIPRLIERYRQGVLEAAFRGDLTADWRGQNALEHVGEFRSEISRKRWALWSQDASARVKDKGKKADEATLRKRYPVAGSADERVSVDIPDGWCIVSLDELAWGRSYGTSAKCDYGADGVPVARIPNVAKGILDLGDVKFACGDLGLSAGDELAAGDLIIVRTNGSKDLVGRGAVVLETPSSPTYFASYLIRFRLVDTALLRRWVGLLWHSPLVRDQVLAQAATSAGQYNVSMSELAAFAIPLAPPGEMVQIIERVDAAFAAIELVEAEYEKAAALLPRLETKILDKAFAGELVPQDPADEPAAELLARIKAARAEAPATRGRRRKA